MDRTGLDTLKVEQTSKDLFTEFNKLSEERMLEAIRKGSLGTYGKTYKLTTQEICIWIREYLKQTNKHY